jgi:subtilisin family serine protease
VFFARSADSLSNRQYIVEFRGSSLPADLAARMAALGGTVVDVLPEVNLAVVADLSDDAASSLRSQADVSDVVNDELLPRADRLGDVKVALPSPSSATNPESALYFPYEWNMRAIGADRAWHAGFFGNPDVRIAIVDTGIDPSHPDLTGRIDASRSTSFCSGDNAIIAQQFPGYPSWTDLDGHGSAVASVAVSNGNLVAGITSRSTLMAIKSQGLTPCFFSRTFLGIVYAANHGADVINVSLGGNITKVGAKGQLAIFSHVIRYALQKGVSAVVVGAGNSALDLDHDGNNINLYCSERGVICVSATGPTSTGPSRLGPFLNVDTPAFYTNFGSSAIDVAAPGGNQVFDSSGNIVGEGYISVACATTDRLFDANGNIVPGDCSGNGFLAAAAIGTSFAAPHVSGLAALLVGQFGRGNFAQVKAAIENSADDLGKPGTDPFYGKGRINVARALGVQ